MSRPQRQPINRVSGDAGNQRRFADDDPHVDNRPGFIAYFGERATQNIMNAEVLRFARSYRDIAGADTHSHALTNVGVDAGHGQRTANKFQSRQIVVRVVRFDAGFDHRAGFVAPCRGGQIEATHDFIDAAGRQHPPVVDQHHGIGEANYFFKGVADQHDGYGELIPQALNVGEDFRLAVSIE